MAKSTPRSWLSIRQLQTKLGESSRSRIYQLIQDGKFPKPIKFGTSSVWPEHVVDAWMAGVEQQQGA